MGMGKWFEWVAIANGTRCRSLWKVIQFEIECMQPGMCITFPHVWFIQFKIIFHETFHFVRIQVWLRSFIQWRVNVIDLSTNSFVLSLFCFQPTMSAHNGWMPVKVIERWKWIFYFRISRGSLAPGISESVIWFLGVRAHANDASNYILLWLSHSPTRSHFVSPSSPPPPRHRILRLKEIYWTHMQIGI